MSGCIRCGDTGHCACYHGACCTCGSKEHVSCGDHPEVNESVEHGDDWCIACAGSVAPPAFGVAEVRLPSVGEEGCTLYVPVRSVRTGAMTYEIHFDTSATTLQRLREAMRRALGQP